MERVRECSKCGLKKTGVHEPITRYVRDKYSRLCGDCLLDVLLEMPNAPPQVRSTKPL